MIKKNFMFVAILRCLSMTAHAMPLQPLSDKVTRLRIKGMEGKVWYVPSTVDTIKWGYLPNTNDKPLRGDHAFKNMNF
jgi:hypothetical protein